MTTQEARPHIALAVLNHGAQLHSDLCETLHAAGAEIVYEASLQTLDYAALGSSGARVVVVNLALDQVSQESDDAAADTAVDRLHADGYDVVFNEVQDPTSVDAEQRARWVRHLVAKILHRPDFILPPQPQGAPMMTRVEPSVAVEPISQFVAAPVLAEPVPEEAPIEIPALPYVEDESSEPTEIPGLLYVEGEASDFDMSDLKPASVEETQSDEASLAVAHYGDIGATDGHPENNGLIDWDKSFEVDEVAPSQRPTLELPLSDELIQTSNAEPIDERKPVETALKSSIESSVAAPDWGLVPLTDDKPVVDMESEFAARTLYIPAAGDKNHGEPDRADLAGRTTKIKSDPSNKDRAS